MNLGSVFGLESNDKAPKATDLLKEDHSKVKGLFRAFKKAKEAGDGAERQRLFLMIDRELSLHAVVEEEIFYPAVKKKDAEAKDHVLEANEEHAVVKTLLGELRDLTFKDDTFDPKMKVLMESVEHHADEEESDMFPEAEELGDAAMRRLGGEIASRKAQLERSPALLAQLQRSKKARNARGGRTSARAKKTAATASRKSSATRGSRKTATAGKTRKSAVTGRTPSPRRTASKRSTRGRAKTGTGKKPSPARTR